MARVIIISREGLPARAFSSMTAAARGTGLSLSLIEKIIAGTRKQRPEFTITRLEVEK